VSLAGQVEATGPTADALQARGRITRLEQRSPEGTIALAAPAEWTLANGLFVQSPLRLSGPLGTLEASAEARLAGGPTSGTAVITGPLDLRMVSPFVQDTTIAGPARVDVRASWDSQGVRLRGAIAVDDGRMTLEQLAFTASRIKGELRLLGDRATLDATAASGDGRIVASGAMSFGPRLVGPGELKLEAQRVAVSYPEGFRARATGTIRVAGDASGYTVGGEIGLTQAYYTAEFDNRRQSLDRLDWQLAALRGGQSLTESMPLSVRVRLDDPLRIRNSQAQLDITGALITGGTLAQPVTTGQLTLLEGGQLTVRRARIRASRGRVELNGYPAGNPEVDFSGLTQVSGIGMELRATGTLDDLQLQISSPNRPDLSQTDLVSVLLTGRTAQAAAADSGAIVAEELATALGGVLQKGVGESLLVDVAPDQSLLSSNTDPTQRFNVGTRLRQDLIVLYSTRLDGAEQRWIIDWNPRGGRLRFRAISETDEGTAFEVTDRFSFNVLGRRATTKPKKDEVKVVGVTLTGALPLPPEQLLEAAGLKKGNRYSALRLEQAADRVRERLAKGGFRAAQVDATWAVAQGQKQSVQVELRVEAGPEVRVSWAGDDPGGKVREEALAAWPAYASPETAAAVIARAARVGLRARGYYDARVDHELQALDGRADVRLKVAVGPKGAGIDVRFEGNEALGQAALAATLPKPGSRAFFEALEGRSDRLTGEARLAYARIGHLQARVGPPRQAFDATTGRLQVVVPVRERTASRVSEIALPPEVLEAGSEGPKLTLRAGEPFDVSRYLADRDAIAAWYRAGGWTEARLRGVLEPSGQDVVVRYAAAAGPRPRVNEVRIATEGRPKEPLLRRSVALSPGELITPDQLARSRERLSELQIFRSVDVRPEPVEGRDDVRDVVVSYVERPDLDLEYGVRYSASGTSGVGGAPSTPDNGRIQLAGGAAVTDPFGWGWRLRPYAYLMSDRYTYGLGLESASLFGLRVRTRVQLFDDRDTRAEVSSLASRVRGWSVEQTRPLLRDTSSKRWHDRLRLQWGYANKDIQYTPVEGAGEALIGGNRAYASVSLIGDERDSLTDPRRGVFWTLSTEVSRTAFGSDVDYVRFYGQGFVYLPLPLKMVWAQGYRAGVVPGTNPLLLLENRFQAGGPMTVRGFSQNDLGPQTAEDQGLGGQGLIILNQELRFPVWKQLAGGLFWDAGNVWALSRDVSLGDLRQSVGAGLRVMFPFGPVRLEYAWVVNPLPGESRSRFVFGLGHAF
jgi:outer membrane protein insertion porin family